MHPSPVHLNCPASNGYALDPLAPLADVASRYNTADRLMSSMPDSTTSATPLTAPQRRTPVLFDEEKQRQFCQLLRHGIAKGAAARLLGLAPRTVQLTVQNDPELADSVRQARLECHSRAAAQVARAGEKSWRAAVWVLEQGKRRSGAGRPRKAAPPIGPRAQDQMKQLVRNVLLEAMPELHREITNNRSSLSSLAQAAPDAVDFCTAVNSCDALDACTADRKARLVAFVDEAKAIRERGESPDLDALWHKHLPEVPRNKAHSNAQRSPFAALQPSPEITTSHHVKASAPEVGIAAVAHFP